jgi:putative ABC transport system permease protein
VAVTVQVALALVLVTGAAMFGETMMRLAMRPLGFDPENLGVASIRLVRPPAATATFEGNPRDRDRFLAFLMRERVMGPAMHLDALFQRIEVLPGVESAAGATAVPFVGDLPRMDVRPLGSLPDATQTFHYQGVTHGYFETMRIPILEGRDFAAEDRQGRRVAIVSAELGRRLFADEAVGRQIVWGNQPETAETYEVIGVVGNVKQRDLSDDELSVVYLLNWQGPAVNHVVVRTAGAASVVLPALRQTIEQHGPEYAVTSMTTLDERLALSLHEERFRAVLASVFGFAALVLAAVGLYSLTARQVIERRQEIGVRAALGARPGHVRALMLRDGLIALGMGLVIGVPAAYAAAQSARTLLFGVAPTDPHLILTAVGVLAVTAVCASLVPANQASRIDPSVTLRE